MAQGFKSKKTGTSWSDGEFANTLKITFANLDDAHVSWDHWEFRSGEKEAIFSYSLDAAHTRLAIATQVYRAGTWQPAEVYVPYTGFFYANVEDGSISRLVVNTGTLPSEYAMSRADSVLDYGRVEIGGKLFSLLTDSRVSSGPSGMIRCSGSGLRITNDSPSIRNFCQLPRNHNERSSCPRLPTTSRTKPY